MKKLGIGLLALVLVLVAAVLIGPSFVDWNAHKGRIAAEVRERTGRDLTIEGDVSLAILPTPALSVQGLKLANLPDGSAPTMVELESLRIRVALLPLLGGDVQVERVSLVKPVILVEVLADGRRNWEFVTRAAGASDAVAEDGAPVADGGLPGEFRLDSFTIEQGTVIYRDAVRGISERIEGLDAEIAAESLEGPFLIRGEARVRDTATRFDVSLGRLVEDGATPLNLGVTLSEARAKVQFGGALSLHGESSSLRGSFKAEGPDLAAAAAAVPGGPTLPPALAKSFALEADVSADSQSVSAAELIVRLGEIAAEGELQVALGPPPDVRLRLAATQINLDRLLASAAAEPGSEPGAGRDTGPGEGSGGAPEPAAAAGPPAGLPGDLTANVQLSVDALVYRDQVVRQALADLTLSEGRLEVGQALALLPGGSDASLTGTLASADDGGHGLRFDGRAELASDNLRGMLEWLGADLSAVPPERLRKMSLTTRIGATAEQLTASEIDLRVDLSRATGGVVVALRERPGLGIGLSVDRVNLDAYLPSEETPGAGGDPAGEAQPDGVGGQANRTPGPGPLERFDANLDLRLGSLTYRGVALGDLRLDATLAQGALTVREARVGNLSGGSARFAGKLDDLSTAPQVDGTVALEVGDPVRVARLAGIEGDLPARIGAFELGGTVSGGAQELGFDLELAALDGNFGFDGSAAPLAAPPSFDLRVSAQHGDLAGLLRALAPDLALGSGLGGLEITARAAGNPAAITVSELSGTIGPAEATGGFALALDQSGPVARDVGLDLAIRHSDLGALAQSLAPQSGLQPGLGALDLEGRVTGSSESLQVADLSGRAGPAELSGSVGLALAGPTPGLAQLDLDVALRHEDLPALGRRLNPGLALAPGLGGVDLGARVTGEQNRFEVSGLSGTLGPTELSGRLGLDLSGAKPSLSADLTTGVLPAAGLLAPAAGGGKAGSGSPTSARDAAGRWSREPIDVSALDTFNADLKLTSEALVFDKARLEKATVNLGLLDGILDLRKLSGTLFGGALSVTGKVDTRASLDVGVAVTAIELDLARLLRTVAETDRVSGPLDINATLSAHGESEAELVSSLSGDGEISGTLTVKAKAEEQVGSMLLGILGERVREIRGVTDATNLLFNAFAGTPAAVQGTFRVENGVVRTEDTLVRGKQARAVTRGNADLPRWLLDTTTDLYREGESGTPYLTVDLSGPLDSPNPRLRGQVLQRQPTPQVAPSGPQPSGPSPTMPEGQAPAPGPLPQSPEDALRKGLEGLIKGLGN